jgi:hypothetical protein
VLDVLTLRSGLVLEALLQKPELWRDSEALVDAIGDAARDFPRGALAYEAYAFGWILAEGDPASLRATNRRARIRRALVGSPGFRLGGVRLADSFEARAQRDHTRHARTLARFAPPPPGGRSGSQRRAPVGGSPRWWMDFVRRSNRSAALLPL